ncbi:PREDICTED: golgin subfamily A member 8J isoform X2 [Ipomoea nil]|uniref:golgin subfamily A member 8J isoform X2 n=1 Tax=Ipomoea nil TaxID=35883 RepID=UPI0009011310|nr:PREDICTED: golgin subfamily A member 8J isoform X2 [Ipomoea nil]
MLKEGDNPTTPSALTSKPDQTTSPNPNAFPKEQRPSPRTSESISSRSRGSKLNENNDHSSQPQGNPQNPEEFILLVASKFASQPLQYSDPDVWGVLTAISDKARKRNQGINILLTAGEHRIGRLVGDARFQISSPAVSASHCKIYRKRIANEDTEHNTLVFLKDSSTNGTYLNWEKLNKNSPEARLKHGDIISIAFAPQHEHAFAFVFREVLRPSSSAEEVAVKRKAEEFGGDSKRLKGIGIGTPEGPISLDDFRSMQRSNTELRKQLEDQVANIDALRNEYRATVERHETEVKVLRDSVSKSYLDQLKELNQLLEAKEKEIVESNRISAEQKHALEDLNERLSASEQSCLEANEVINSQKASLLELKALLDEEREQRKEEREKAALDLKASIQRVQAEAQEEIKRHSDAALRREKEQQEMIYKLQESEKERCSLVETMRLKLEETRQKLVNSDNKARQLEAQMHEEQLASVSNRKRIEELEHEKKRLRKELEREKSAREEAWAKVSVLELEINSAVRDLDFERRRLKAARERIMLRETQLRAFYSTTEQISVLFGKQQEQLRSMQRTLEDEENYENTSVEVELEPNNFNVKRSVVGERELGRCIDGGSKAGLSDSAHKHVRDAVGTSSDASVTEKHECNVRSQEEGQDTQEVEFTSTERCQGAFGSDINGVETVPMMEGDTVGTEQIHESGANIDLVGTETVVETESPAAINGDRSIDLNKCCNTIPAEDTMQLDVNTNETEAQRQEHTALEVEVQNPLDDTEAVGGSIRTADLLASEAAGSWACSTAPSVHGENNSSQRSKDESNGAGPSTLPESSSCAPVAESQSAPSSSKENHTKRDQDRKALSEMIGIIAPDLKEQFSDGVGDNEEGGGFASNSETESCTDDDDDVVANTEVGSDAETIGSDAMDEDGD